MNTAEHFTAVGVVFLYLLLVVQAITWDQKKTSKLKLVMKSVCRSADALWRCIHLVFQILCVVVVMLATFASIVAVSYVLEPEPAGAESVPAEWNNNNR